MDFGDFLREASQEMEFSEGTRRVSAPYRFPHIAPRTFYAFLASTTPPPMSHWAVTDRLSRGCRPSVSHRRGLLMRS